MRADDIRSTTFQTKTSASGEKITPPRVVDQAQQLSQTRAIRLGRRKGENGILEIVSSELEEVRIRWLKCGDVMTLRPALLQLLIRLDTRK